MHDPRKQDACLQPTGTASLAEVPLGFVDQVRLAATPRSSAAARAFIRERAARAGFDPDSIADIEVAVGEAMTNAIEHGQTGDSDANEISVAAEWDGETFTIMISDHGPGFRPGEQRAAPQGDGVMERGRGLFLMEVLMDTVEFQRNTEGMTVRMTRRLPTTP